MRIPYTAQLTATPMMQNLKFTLKQLPMRSLDIIPGEKKKKHCKPILQWSHNLMNQVLIREKQDTNDYLKSEQKLRG